MGPDGQVNGCVKKAGKKKGTLRVIPPGKRCKRSERAIAFSQRGPAGAAGAAGEQGPTGAPGATGPAGSPDTPPQVLAKLREVDGDGSVLDSDLLDGHETAFFQRRGSTTACAAGDRVTGIDANGDVSCATDATAPTGTAGGALAGTYPNPSLAQPPSRQLTGTSPCPANASIGQEIPNDSETPLNYTNQSGNAWPTGTQPCNFAFRQLVAPRDGVYMLTAGLLWPANATGQRGLGIALNGVQFATSRTAAAAIGDTHSNVARVIRANDGDVFTAIAYQTSGGPLSIVGAFDHRNFLSGVWIGP